MCPRYDIFLDEWGVYHISSILLLPMSWRCTGPGHQQSWYWPLQLKYSILRIRKVIFFSLNARVILLRFFSLNAILHRGSCAGDLHFFLHFVSTWVKSQLCDSHSTSKTNLENMGKSLQWHHNERDSVSNHRRLDCLLNRWFKCGLKKRSKLRVTGFCKGKCTGDQWIPSERASYAENVSIWWRHYGIT